MQLWLDPKLVMERLDTNTYSLEVVSARKKLFNSGIKIKELKSVFSDVKCGPFGTTIKTEQYTTEGVLLARPINIAENFFDVRVSCFVSEQDVFDAGLPLYSAGDLLIARVGYPRVGLIPQQVKKVTIGPNLIACISKTSYDSAFYYAYFITNIGQALLSSLQKEVAQPTIGTEELANLPVPIPVLNIQIAIGNKVRKAERLKELAEQKLNLAKRKFYEGTRTKPILGPFKPSFWCKPDNILDRLDSWPYQPRYKQMLSEIKTIAQNKNLDEVATFVKARASTGEQKSSNYYIEIGDVDINSGRLKNKQQPGTLPSGPKLLVKKGDILVSKVRPHRGAIAIVPEDFDLALATTGFCQLRVKGESFEKYYLWFVLRQSITLHQFEQWSSGSTYPTIEDEYIRKRIIIPWKEEKERKIIGELCKDAIAKQYLSDSLINNAKSDVEALIEGTLDEAKLLAESAEIEQWLKENPSPYATA